jgi:hypothetical protein
MEHRFSPRSAIALSADIYHDERHLGSFTTRDVGYRGLFVETGQVGLLCGSVVRVSLAVPETSQRLVVNAVVVHYSAEGAGLLFTSDQAESLSAVRRLLRSAA